jgi:CRP/FNR family cyclic AMP-dependent transcriptional regulator
VGRSRSCEPSASSPASTGNGAWCAGAEYDRPVRLRKTTKVDLMGRVPLFSECSKSELGKVAAVADELALGAGAELMREGERGREFVVIVDGSARVERGGERIATLGPGDFAGEIALVANVPRTATVVADTALRLLVLSDRSFQTVIRETPSIAVKVLAVLGQRLAAQG